MFDIFGWVGLRITNDVGGGLNSTSAFYFNIVTGY